jgi:hypothetical protein
LCENKVGSCGYDRINILNWDILQAVLLINIQKKENLRQNAILGELLRTIRKEQSLRQTEVFRRLKKPQSYVSKYESGHRRLDLTELRCIAEAMDVPLNEIVSRFENIIR